MNKSLLATRRQMLQLGGALGVGVLAQPFGSFSAFGQDVPSVEIINSAGVLGQAMQNVMAEKGYAQEQGVKINYSNIASGAQIVSGLIGGSGDACMWSGFPQVLPALENGAELKIIAGCSMVPLLGMFSSKPEIQSVHDLVGKTIGSGATGSLLHVGAVALLRKYGIDESQVNFVNLGSSPAVVNATSQGVVDAGLGEAEITGQMEELGIHLLAEGELWNELPNFTWQAAYATDRAIAEKRDGLVRALAAHAQLYRYLSSPASWDSFNDGRTKFAGEENVNMAKAYWDFIQTRQPFAVNLEMDESRFTFVQELNVSLGTQTKVLPFAQVADMSLAKDALALIGGPV